MGSVYESLCLVAGWGGVSDANTVPGIRPDTEHTVVVVMTVAMIMAMVNTRNT